MDIKFSIITPTYNRDLSIVKRCIDSVNGQSYNNWEHIIISDCDYDEVQIKELCENMPNCDKRVYMNTGKQNSNTWGAYPRNIAQQKATGDFCLFLDDDNIIMSHSLRIAHDIIDDKTLAVIWSIYHNGPLSTYHIPDSGVVNNNTRLSYILSGIPPEKYKIDTLNLIIKTNVICEVGWVCNVGYSGYCNDGDTYDKIFKGGIIKNDEIKITPEILGVHL